MSRTSSARHAHPAVVSISSGGSLGPSLVSTPCESDCKRADRLSRPPTWPPPHRENEPLPPQGALEYWRALTAPVLGFLEEEPRNWKALNQWAKEARFGKSRIRHALAWLEQRGEASTFTQVEGRRETVYWASAAWLARHTEPPLSRT